MRNASAVPPAARIVLPREDQPLRHRNAFDRARERRREPRAGLGAFALLLHEVEKRHRRLVGCRDRAVRAREKRAARKRIDEALRGGKNARGFGGRGRAAAFRKLKDGAPAGQGEVGFPVRKGFLANSSYR